MTGSAPARKGFAMSLEALCSIILLLAAASAMGAFHFAPSHAPDFYLCSDAAVFLSRQGVPSSGLQAQVDEISILSGRCVSFESGKTHVSSCEDSQAADERLAFTIIALEDGEVGEATVSCWLPG